MGLLHSTMIIAPRKTMSLVRRRLFRVLSVLSLVLWLALAVLWAWTRNHHVVVTSGIRGRLAYVAAWSEGLRVDLVSDWPTRERPQTSGGDFRQWHPHAEILSPGTRAVRFDPPGLTRESGVACFRLNGGPWRPRRYRGVVLRWWPLFLLSGVMPVGWATQLWIQRQRGRRAARLRAEVRCVRCGYDLRASPQRCPECGTAAEAVSR